MSDKTAFWLLGVYAVVWVVVIYGYVANIAKIVYSLNEPITAMLIARFFGTVVAPLGVVLGYF